MTASNSNYSTEGLGPEVRVLPAVWKHNLNVVKNDGIPARITKPQQFIKAQCPKRFSASTSHRKEIPKVKEL